MTKSVLSLLLLCVLGLLISCSAYSMEDPSYEYTQFDVMQAEAPIQPIVLSFQYMNPIDASSSAATSSIPLRPQPAESASELMQRTQTISADSPSQSQSRTAEVRRDSLAPQSKVNATQLSVEHTIKNVTTLTTNHTTVQMQTRNTTRSGNVTTIPPGPNTRNQTQVGQRNQTHPANATKPYNVTQPTPIQSAAGNSLSVATVSVLVAIASALFIAQVTV